MALAAPRIDDGIVHEALRRDCAHNGGVVDSLGHRDEIQRHAEELARGRLAQTPETGDEFIENQKNAVLRADFAQLLQVAFRRHEHVGRTCERLDDHRRNGRCIVQRDDALQFFREMFALRGLSPGKRVVREIVRMRQMINRGQQRARKRLAVRRNAAHRNPTEIPPKSTP